MSGHTATPWASSGVRRLVRAMRHTHDGIRHALMHDSAIRQVSLACAVLSLIALALPVTYIEKLLLIAPTMLVVLVEYINSAIEATVDRISLDSHPLSKQAKDLGSVAVGISVTIAGLCWTVIVGALVLR